MLSEAPHTQNADSPYCESAGDGAINGNKSMRFISRGVDWITLGVSPRVLC